MKWKIILKAGENPDDAESRQAFDRKLEDYSYDVTIDMFADQNWIQTIKRILTPSLPKTMDYLLELSPQMAMTILNSILEESNLGEVIEEGQEKHKESTRLYADEGAIVRPKEGSAGRGMMPKRVEYLTKQVSRVMGDLISNTLKVIHKSYDKKIHEGLNVEEEIQEDNEMDDGRLNNAIQDRIWQLQRNYTSNTLRKALDEVAKTINIAMKGTDTDFEISVNQINHIKNLIMDEDITQEWMVHLYALASVTVTSGMARTTKGHSIERFFGDKLSPEELKFMMDHAEYDMLTGMVKLPTDELGIPKDFNVIEDSDAAREAYQKWVWAQRTKERQESNKGDEEEIEGEYDEEGKRIDIDQYDDKGNLLRADLSFQKAWKIIKGCRGCGGSNLFDMRL